MSRDKPYRRFRARGGGPTPAEQGAPGEGRGEAGLEALRALNREAAGGAGSASPSRQAPAPAPAPSPLAPGRGERRRRRAAQRGPGRWWSPVGRGFGGWAWRLGTLALVGLVVWAGLGMLALYNAASSANDRITPGAQASLDTPPGGMLGTPHNTLIIGTDALPGRTRSRADTILVMRTDPDAGEIRYLSIPRDWRVELPQVGASKINAAFALYGQQGIIRAVKGLTGLPIHHVIVIKFNGFERLVGELGGVAVINPVALENCPYPGGTTVSFPAGRLDLDAEEALQFARVRSCDSDFARALRQQSLVAGMRGRILAPAGLWRAPWRGAAAVDTMNTDIGTFDMVKFGWLQARLDQDPADRILLTGAPQTIGGESFVVSQNPDQNEREIARFVSGGE